MSILSKACNGEQVRKWPECRIDAARLDQAAADSERISLDALFATCSAAIPPLGEGGQ
jgi:hypothetical protein